MTSSMLEKAARVAYEKFPDVEWQPGRVAGAYLTWDELLPADRRKKIAFMRVALLAIREPDEAMVEACKGALSAHFAAMPVQIRNRYRNFKHGLKVPPRLKAVVRHQAMIDAILGEAPKP